MTHLRCSSYLALSLAASGCMGSATARLELANQTATPAAHASAILADGTSLRLKLVAAYLAEDVDPVTQNNVGGTAMIWLNPECNGDISGCNVAGFAQPPGPRITQYFDLSRPTAEVNAELNSQDAAVASTPRPITGSAWTSPSSSRARRSGSATRVATQGAMRSSTAAGLVAPITGTPKSYASPMLTTA